MRAKGTLEVEFSSEDSADAAFGALSHEKDVAGRSKASLSKEGNTLIISLVADDVVALRAAINAYLRALQVFEGLEKEVRK